MRRAQRIPRVRSGIAAVRSLFAWLAIVFSVSLWAAPEPVPVAPVGPSFQVEAATRAYLDRLPAEERARSNAYFEGGYWLQLWDFLCGMAIAALLLESRCAAKLRIVSERMTRFKSIHAFAYWAQYSVLAAALGFPLALYSGYFREHKYGLATQAFPGWFWDYVKGLLVTVVLGGVLIVMLMGLVRRSPRSWPTWGSVVAVPFLAFTILIGPVFIAPLFNQYTRLSDPKVLNPILSMARANGIPASEVFEVDASRQSTRISANVSGLFGTERITLNDNLLARCSLPEIKAVMGHEMGHYVLHHGYAITLFFGVLIMVGMTVLRWVLDRLLRWRGSRWDITATSDLAVIPLAVFLFSAGSFITTPLTNTFIRVHESEADMFGLNASQEPDGFAEAILKLSDYRKLEPTPFEEWVFYDHPSGRTRIRAAMRWKAEHLGASLSSIDHGPAVR